jgi:hypothetical protein
MMITITTVSRQMWDHWRREGRVKDSWWFDLSYQEEDLYARICGVEISVCW